MPSNEKFSLIRSVLKTLGLSPSAINDITNLIDDFLSDGKKSRGRLEYPYHIRDDFLSRAEHSFYLVLNHVVSDEVVICPKVSLGDLFYVRSRDPSKFRTYTNKIDRKHVDFLLCDPKTMQPIVGIELDDKSHNNQDRRARDKFVEKVYAAAMLPLVRFPARRSYATRELESALRQYLNPEQTEESTQPVVVQDDTAAPQCPKCGTEMVLRTAKKGPNPGQQFWGCPNYPRCHGVRKYNA
jgi:predicted RNA-binding Zn-ribbon protein involved in translation (DUF1610 family)